MKPRKFEQHLPEELQEVIFLRLPVESLLRIRSVCKTWKTLIDSRSFKLKQLEAANKSPSSYLLWRSSVKKNRYDHSVPFLHFISPHSFEITPPLDLDKFVDPSFINPNTPCNFHPDHIPLNNQFGVANGLVLLCWNKKDVVWNPLNNHFCTIDPPRFDSRGRCLSGRVHAIGFDPKTQDYKVVIAYFTLALSSGKAEVVFHVYSIKNKSWRFGLFGFTRVNFVSVVADGFLNGKSYWYSRFCTKQDGSGVGPGLVVFDYSDETFELISLPWDLTTVNRKCVAVTTRGCVELILSLGEGDKERHGEVWGMVEEDGSWVRKLRVVLPSGMDLRLPRGITKDGQLLFEPAPWTARSSEMMLVDSASGSCKNLGHLSSGFRLFAYVESLFSIIL